VKILLINPNRYRTPPVPPLGLEYLENALSYTQHECRICDLCFSADPLAVLQSEIDRFTPDVAGVTVRNIDTVIASNNVFFLDDIKCVVDHLKMHGIPVIAGGMGYSFIPDGILAYLGADWGVRGPGERAIVHMLDLLELEPPPVGTVFDGWAFGFDSEKPVKRGSSVDYERYIKEGGLVGFETQKGCKERCSYCCEGSEKVIFRSPQRIVEELGMLAERGFTDYHLCDTEFNQDLSFCHAFLETLINKGPAIRWTLYMKSSPYDEDLFRLLAQSGAYLITLSIPTGEDGLVHAREITRLAKKYVIKIAVDMLVGLPGETLESVKRNIEALRDIQPDTAGVNSTLRLYPGDLSRSIFTSEEYRNYLSGAVQDNPDCIRPVFYSHITVDNLRDIIGDDPLFKIEGFERTSNYERLQR